MAFELEIPEINDKVAAYQLLAKQVKPLIGDEKNTIANLANFCAALKNTFDWLWVGFYLVDSEDELVLGPFQGPVGCTRIQKGRGVCGHTWENQTATIVEDVDDFVGHISCTDLSKSEIVIPLFDSNNNVWAVLDVDSAERKAFDQDDLQGLTACLNFLDPPS